MSRIRPTEPNEIPFWATPSGVAGLVAIWGLAHLMLRAGSTPVLGTDDMFENILVQALQPGYMLRQPPLYEWLLWTFQQVFGPTIWSFLTLKYGLISLSALFLFLIARRAIADVRLAALCVFSYSLFYQFGWNLHEGVTHTVVLVTACSATAWAFLKSLETGAYRFYCALGIAAGAGLLAKHSYPIFLLAFVFAVVSDPVWRRRLKWSGLGLVFCVAALTYSPYLWWMVGEGLGLFSDVSTTMGVKAEASHAMRAATGLTKLLWGLIGFSFPLLLILLVLFRKRLTGAMRVVEPSVNDTARLCGRVVLAMVVLTAFLIAMTGATYVKERHMHPLMLLLPIWIFAELSRFEAGRRWHWLGVILAGCVMVAFLARVPGLIAPDPIACGGKCRHMKPYADLKVPLVEFGAADATLVGEDAYTGGNLRVLFPGARVVTPQIHVATPPRSLCFYVWEAGEIDPTGDLGAEFTRRTGRDAEGSDGGVAAYLSGSWPHLWKPAGWRTTWWGIRELPGDDQLCR